jgi:hypothetical protein
VKRQTVKRLAKQTQTADTRLLNATQTSTADIYPGETGRWLVAYNPETGTTT